MQAQETGIEHTCWMGECPGSCASGAEDRIWCLALMASRNPSPQGPSVRERHASRWTHIGGTAGLRSVRGRCSECACASVARRSPPVRPWQWWCCVVQLFFLLLPPAVAICFNCPCPGCTSEKASALGGVHCSMYVRKDMPAGFTSYWKQHPTAQHTSHR